MIQGRVSVIVPSRTERYLCQTVVDVLAKASGDVEVIVIADGSWPDPPLPSDKRIKILHRGTALGLRPAICAAVQIATGQYLLKVDAHTLWASGWDTQLKADYHEDTWVLVPRRYALDPDAWALDETNRKYPIDYHFLTNPLDKGGLHGQPWTERRDARMHLELDDEMSAQGSAWFLSRKCYDWLGEPDNTHYGPFYQEFQELGNKAWCMGGAVKVTKRTWYAHWRKPSRQYPMADFNQGQAKAYCSWFWMTEQSFPGRVRSFQSLVEHFSPVPGWPADLDAVFARAQRELAA